MRVKGISRICAHDARGATWVVLAALLLFGLAAGSPAWGQEAPDGGGPVGLAVEVGWDGKAMPGQVAPAVVTLENRTSRDLAGVIEVVNYYKEVPPPPPGSPPGTAPGPARYRPASAYGERVSLPAGSRKEVTLWFPLVTPDRMLFRFRSGDEVLARLETSLPGASLLSGGPLPQAVGILGAVPQALEKTRILAPDGVPRVPMIIPLTARLFPEAGEDLDAFRTILVAGGEAGKLSQRQRQALAEWVEQGGNLVLAGGLALASSMGALPEGLVEVEGRGMETHRDWQTMAAWLDVAPPPPVAAVVARLAGAGSDWGPDQAPWPGRSNWDWVKSRSSPLTPTARPGTPVAWARPCGSGCWCPPLIPPRVGGRRRAPSWR